MRHWIAEDTKGEVVLKELVKRLGVRFNIKRHFESIQADLDKVEQRILDQIDLFDSSIRDYVEYTMQSQGKRIRPALCLLAAQASGKVTDAHYHLAVIVEMIHLASLVHDDIMDNALIRRARPTAYAKWGPELAVLLGDCLFVQALKLCDHFEDSSIGRTLADTTHEVCTGEILQTQRRFDINLRTDEYYRMIEMKTGALFRVSTELAGHLSKVPDAWTNALRTYGRKLGSAYQIYDDCLDLFALEETTGKTVGTDLAKGKLTLPILHVLEQLSGEEHESFTEMILSKDPAMHEKICVKVIEQGGHLMAVQRTQEILEQAEKSLYVLQQTPARTLLEALPQALHTYMEQLKT